MKNNNVLKCWLVTPKMVKEITNQAKTLSKVNGQHITESEVVRRIFDIHLTQVKGQK